MSEELFKKSVASGSDIGYALRSSVSNAKFEVEKFDGTNNFGMWQCEVQDVLVQQGLDIALEDKPEDMGDKDWDKVNRQACGTIRLCLAKDQKYFVMRETKAKDLWKKLEDKFMTKSVENRLYLKKKLFRFQFRAGSSMNEHLSDFNKILADLQNLDAKILDEDKALILLNSLPDSYDHLVTTLLYGKEEIRFEDVSNALTNNEYRLRDKETHQDTFSQGLIVGTKARPQSSKVPPFASPTGIAKEECAYCHNKGHWKRDCPVLRRKRDTNSNYASDRDDDLGINLVSPVLVSHSMKSKWILDSGCSYHLCPNRDWFSSLKKLDGGDVLVGNGHTCKTLGIGTIDLVMHDGFVWTLDDVRYVPDARFNLISLGALESAGSVITLKGGALKVMFGNLVVMEGVRRNNLYFLEGSTVLGGAATGALDIGESVLDTTALVHGCFDDLGKQSGVCFGEHYALEKQLGVKFGMAVDHFFGALDFVWGSSFVNVDSLEGMYQSDLLVDFHSRCYWIYPLDFGFENLYGYLEVGKGEEETAIRMDGTLEPGTEEIESNYLTRLVVTLDSIPRTTIRTLFPRLHLWKRSDSIIITLLRCRFIEGKIVFKLQQSRGLFLSAELGMQASRQRKRKKKEIKS